MPATRALSSPSGEAAEDNVKEREFVPLRDVTTPTEVQMDVKVEIVM